MLVAVIYSSVETAYFVAVDARWYSCAKRKRSPLQIIDGLRLNIFGFELFAKNLFEKVQPYL